MKNLIVVIGGGAAGIFAAITAAEKYPHFSILVLEKTNTLLAKVRISGGGRCNVTHACFEPRELIKNYPRGNQALLGPFHRFQPRNTIEWFESRGVPLKTEEDGRIFPISDSSESIIECLLKEAKKYDVKIRLKQDVQSIERVNERYLISLASESLEADAVIIATGSRKEGHQLAERLGHHIVLPVPSLFSLNIANFTLVDLAGISVEKACVKLEDSKLTQEGPLLITHWGFSGPAALKLSAWEARTLFEKEYKAKLIVNWLPDYSEKQLNEFLLHQKQNHPSQSIQKLYQLPLAKNLWLRLLSSLSIEPETRLNDISNKQFKLLIDKLLADSYQIEGKTPYKQEFVTCGGVCLDEINFKTLESRLSPGLFFAGEVLDIDGVTGGFNFQNAWTTGWIAGSSIAI